MVFKLLMIALFVAFFIYEVALSVICLKHYRAKVQDLKDSEVWPPRTRIQIELTNAHFFLFTALMIGGAILLGIFAILTENLIALGVYVYVHALIAGFEIIGAWQSFDEEVIIRKALGVVPEPVMIILVVIYAHLCRTNERKLAKSPLFKQFMAAKAGKGETMSDPNYRLTSDEKDGRGDKNNNERQVKITMEEGGCVNEALDLTLDSECPAKSGDTQANTSNRQEPVEDREKKVMRDNIGSSVTVLMDGKTRISVTASDAPRKPVDPSEVVAGHEDSPAGMTSQSQSEVPCVHESNITSTSEQVSPVQEEDKEKQSDSDENQGSSNVIFDAQSSLESSPSDSMTGDGNGPSIVACEEKTSKSEPKQVKSKSSSSESRIL